MGAELDAAAVADNVLASVAQVLIAAHRLFFENVDAELAVRPLLPSASSSSSSLSSSASSSSSSSSSLFHSRAHWLPHTRHLLDVLRYSVLREKVVVFSGLFLRTQDPRAQYEWQLAQQLGLGIAGMHVYCVGVSVGGWVRVGGWVWVGMGVCVRVGGCGWMGACVCASASVCLRVRGVVCIECVELADVILFL